MFLSDIHGQRIVSILFQKTPEDKLYILSKRMACRNLVTLHSLYRPYSGGHTKCSPQNAVEFPKNNAKCVNNM